MGLQLYVRLGEYGLGGQANVLVVDDEASVLVTMGAVLAREGYAVATAESVAKAMVLAERQNFDAAVLDLHLDDGEGLDVLAQLHQRQPQCSVIILTGYATLESAVAAIQQGAYDYLVKPCDITYLKLTVERAVERAYLTRAPAARSDELEERVRQATEELERTAKSRQEFLAAAAHDMRNPLTIIRGFTQVVKRQVARLDLPAGDPLLEALEEVEGSAEQLGGFIDELMDVTRLQAGEELRLETAPIDLVAMAGRLAARHQRTTERHRITVEGSGLEVVGDWDGRRLDRVLSNLLSNAIKYSPAGGDIRVVLRPEDSPGGRWAVLSVHDQGLGIAAKDLDRVFQAFARGDNVVGVIPGVGIGLASARRIIEQHGGAISVESEEGKGSVFTVRLPVTIQHGRPSPVAMMPSQVQAQVGTG